MDTWIFGNDLHFILQPYIILPNLLHYITRLSCFCLYRVTNRLFSLSSTLHSATVEIHWKKKWSHFYLKSWVTRGTKIWPWIPSNWRIFELNWLNIESQIVNLPLKLNWLDIESQITNLPFKLNWLDIESQIVNLTLKSN